MYCYNSNLVYLWSCRTEWIHGMLVVISVHPCEEINERRNASAQISGPFRATKSALGCASDSSGERIRLLMDYEGRLKIK